MVGDREPPRSTAVGAAARRSSRTGGVQPDVGALRAAHASATASGSLPTPPSIPMKTGPAGAGRAAARSCTARTAASRGSAPRARPRTAAVPRRASRSGTRRPRTPRRAGAPRAGRRPRGPQPPRHMAAHRHVVADLGARQPPVLGDPGQPLGREHSAECGRVAGHAHQMPPGHGAHRAAGPDRSSGDGRRLELPAEPYGAGQLHGFRTARQQRLGAQVDGGGARDAAGAQLAPEAAGRRPPARSPAHRGPAVGARRPARRFRPR